jgi:uncharacterized protein
MKILLAVVLFTSMTGFAQSLPQGEANLSVLLKNMKPILNEGEWVIHSVGRINEFKLEDVYCSVKEKEGITVVIKKNVADGKSIKYSTVFSWITLEVHSSLEAVGLTAAFSTALAKANISCNVIAGFYHDHIFVPKKDTQKAIEILTKLSESD